MLAVVAGQGHALHLSPLSPGPESFFEPTPLLVLPCPKAKKQEFPDLVTGVASALLSGEPLHPVKHLVAWSVGHFALTPSGSLSQCT